MSSGVGIFLFTFDLSLTKREEIRRREEIKFSRKIASARPLQETAITTKRTNSFKLMKPRASYGMITM